eukprot:CAMPEP_0194448596 /NCGR_PEP_ID=MMETSP0176-20130528/129665_1 /TAXON_ID=216777 /ORGANISM="Proboscia alata, Strain PI-D3" /LENGTH=54 /DNA_ID=CAMNT_0039275603 /DNA_START=796 /DNA_END=960 /DNA_ORIENTATION=+
MASTEDILGASSSVDEARASRSKEDRDKTTSDPVSSSQYGKRGDVDKVVVVDGL